MLHIAVLVVLLTACDPAGTPAQRPSTSPAATASPTTGEPAGATLRWALREPAAIVPSAVVDDAGLLIVDTLFDSLTSVAGNGTVLPSAASRWDHAENGRRWRFTLRDNARFSDGAPVTAQDFVAAWSMVVREGRTGAHLQDVVGYRRVRNGGALQLSGVQALDDATLEVRLQRPNMEFPAIAAHPSLGPVPTGALREGDAFAAQPVGNGPYQMVEPWARRQFIRVARAAHWANGPKEPSSERVGEILFRTIDPDAAYVGFQQGRIDVAPVPGGALEQARRTYGDAVAGQGPGVVDAPEPSLYFLGMRTDQPPWNDVELRRALSRAIDRQAIVDAQPDQHLDVARAIVSPVLPDAGDAFCDSCLHLPSLAEDAFAQADVTDLTLSYDDGGGHEPIVERLQRDLAEVGVALQVQALPFDDYLRALEDGKLVLYRFGWEAQYPSAGAMLEPLLRSGAPTEAGDGANYGGYTSREVDHLLDAARQTEQGEERQALWTEAETVALREQAIVPLFTFRLRTVISARVENLTLTPWGTATPEQARIIADPEIVDD